MLWVKIGTHIIDHPRFLEVGALARDLWSWGMLYSGKHETDGEIPMAAVMASGWGRGDRGNVKLADTLVSSGLWERTDLGYRVCRWAEQGNETKATLSAKREAAKVRKSPKGSRELSANEQRTNAEGSTSTSLSVVSGSSGSDRVAPAAIDPPPWFVTVLDQLEQVDARLPELEAWLRYDGHRAGKNITPTPKDAHYWLLTVMIPERRREREEARRRDDSDQKRTAAFVAQRSGPEVKPQNSRKAFAERDEWERTAGPPDPETAARMRALIGKVGT